MSFYLMRRLRKKHQFLQYLPSIILVVSMVAYYGKEHLYFNNGAGGVGWQIGQPFANLGNSFPTRSLSQLQSFALELVNRDRRLNGLPPLQEKPLINQVAQSHAEDMLNRNYYDHITPEGKTPTDRFNDRGGQGGIGENIMYQESYPGTVLNYGLLEKFQKSWMYSDGHRDNLLNPDYQYFGFGIVRDPITQKVYAVQNFQ
ncbi:CAP domain-containing protein [Crocosphaera sp. XPORK-15E]|uniref:CAP domain-containing protein n=1 Tax=Crocosphaera sp. XPORK-15E TaxID=3110247 RepID=UPI002B220696|nr:CAP domain-containing protein [Crocosphaera sp. XPORK-15E]MEA5532703.1 CAP domain-containing protein [Crocosphaera sp. XPORK-15E]